MGEKLRKSGIDIIEDVSWGTHFCQFYRTKGDLLEILVPYFTAGLENNELCLWITSHPLGVEEGKEALRRAVPDIDIYLERGQIEIIPCNHWYVEDGIFDSKRFLNSWIKKLDQAVANGYDGLRLSGNTFWLEEKDWDSFVSYEEEIDNIIGNYRMIALCTYSLDRCSATGIIDVVTNHQFALVKKEVKWEQVESSKRRKAEEEALQAAKSWKYTFDAVPDLIAILDNEYRIVRVNRAMAARLKMTPEECVGLTCYRVMHGTDGPPSSCPHQQLLKDGLEHTVEVHEDGLGGDFTVSVSPLHDPEGKLTGCIHVARDITERKQAEEALHQSEQRVRLKLESILSPDREMANLELADIVDAQAIQSLMDDFYKFAHITMALVDLKGNVLVGIGWQDICTKFHRIHPEACKHCVESDTKLSAGVSPGEFKLYKCKNNMWDLATPLIVGGQHVGNIFSGQFFFEDEPVDYELFRSQARKYGFNEDEYIAALEKVPRLSPAAMDTGMTFLAKLAHMISRLSYSNIKLAQSLAEREALVDALRESEEKYRNIVETANEGIWILDAESRNTYVNEKMAEMLGYGQEEIIGRSLLDFADEEGKSIFRSNLEKRRHGISEIYESKLMCKNGLPLWALICAKALLNKEGKFTGSLGMFTDITRRNQEENRIRRYNRILQGINRIFGSIVKAETEEELGVACLSVAVDVTCSQIGFVGEVSTDGLMHDVAISNSGWDECLMYDKTGHRRLPGDHILHGLYGRVINSGKGFFTNDPKSHPDSIGLPEGHPPLRSFLGVPLILDGKTIGILGVANREGGYSCEQQEDLEAIAPAVTQALQRKKAEQERAQAEEALIRSEKRFRTLAENSPDIIARFDRQSRHIYANPAAVEPYGRSPEEIIGKTHGELGMDPEKVKFWEEHHKKVFARGKPETMEFQYISPKGKEYSFNTQVVPEFVDNKVASVLAISHDITNIKKAESRLKETLNNLEELVKARTSELEEAYKSLEESEKGLAEAQKMAHIGNWNWDIATDKAYWSDEMYRILGRNPQESGATYDELLNYIHPDDRDCMNNVIKTRSNGKTHGIDYRIILADGEELIVHAESEVIFDEKNVPVRERGIVQDITERKKAEKALINLEIARKKEIHHRIKNNLQVISSLLDLQAEKFKNRKWVENSEVLESFRESRDRVISIALIHEELHEGEGADTLDFSTYIRELTENLFQTYRYSDKNVDLIMDLEENILFDMDTAVPLGIIVNELVSNSLKHAFPGRDRGEIRIKLRRYEKGEHKKEGDKSASFTLAVSDNGVGIPENSDLENPDSLGIRLITILVDQLDGKLQLKMDSGTEFVISFTVEEKQ